MNKRLWFLPLLVLLLIACSPNSTIKESSEPTSSPLHVEEKGELSVHYVDVGQADATIFHYQDQQEEYVLVYDVGDWKREEVVNYLHALNIDHIHVVMISHPHADHMGQLEKVLTEFKVDEVWMNGSTANTNLFRSSMDVLLESDTAYDEPSVGDTFQIGPLELIVLHPGDLTGDLNDDSLSFKLTYKDVSFLFTGDASTKSEQQIVETNLDVHATFLALGHHGSNTSSDPDFIHAVNPDYAVYSAGIDNTYGHPSKEIIHWFEKEDIPLLGTDKHGTIIVETNGEEYTISTETSEQNSSQQTDHCIDLNHASEEELKQIIHIGDRRAKDIIDIRPISSLEDVKKINGIGPAKLKEIKEEQKACIGGEN